MALACLLVFMAQLATTVYLPSLPAVAGDFGISRGCAELSVSVFVIGAAAPVLFWGIAVDRFGRRGPLLGSLALFVLSSGLLAVTGSVAELLVLRTLQGVAAGGSAIIARIMVRDLWSGAELARRLSVLSIAFIGALGGGQFLGGLIGRYACWEAGFVLLAALGSVAAAAALCLPFEPGRAGQSFSGALRDCLAIGRKPGFLRPAGAGGVGFAVIVLLQEVSPFVLQQRFGLPEEVCGCVGLLLGVAYLAGALTVNRWVARAGSARLMRAGALIMTVAGVLLVALWSLPGIPAEAALAAFLGLYGAITYGQSVLFPNSMAGAVSGLAEQGAYAVGLCGFLQQSTAGAAAAAAVFLHRDLAWAGATAVLAGTACLLTRATGPVRR